MDMNWLENHLGSLGYAGDFYIPSSGGAGSGNGTQKSAGSEQIKVKDTGQPPRVVQTDKYDFPRIQKFFEWDQFLDWVDWRGREGKRASQATDYKAYDRTLTSSFQEAMGLARYGWQNGLLALKNIPQIDIPVKQIIQQSYNMQARYDVAGGTVNVGRYLMGMPDCMRRTSSVQAHCLPARIQKVVIIGDFDCETATGTVLKHGFMVYQIIDALERANIQTEITVAFHTNKYKMYAIDDFDTYETYIKIKEPTDTIYPEKLLFCLAHPSMMRRLVLSEWERNSWDVRQFFKFYTDSIPGGYGRHIPTWLPSSNIIQAALVIPSPGHSVEFNQAVDLVRKMITNQYEKAR